jgi:hypothetical protein
VSTTAEQIAALEAQIPKAGMEVQEGSRRVRYPALDQIMAGLAVLRKRQAIGGGSGMRMIGITKGDGK